MLRVRPIIFTPNHDGFGKLFTALGLELVEDADGWQVFEAGSGRVALHIADQPSIQLNFEVGSVSEFARRTAQAGTDAVVVYTNDGPAAQVTAPNGRVFLAYETLTGEQPAATGLTVMPIWYTPDTAAAEKVFTDIGAKKRRSSDAGAWLDFTAKNGGLLAVHAADDDGAELAFEFAGNVEVIQQRLRSGGVPATLIDESYGRSLRLPNPDGGEIWVNEWQEDLYGYKDHAAS
ncbi:hypothetical protein GCM10027403_17650 [Arthrobacter tecti]